MDKFLKAAGVKESDRPKVINDLPPNRKTNKFLAISLAFQHGFLSESKTFLQQVMEATGLPQRTIKKALAVEPAFGIVLQKQVLRATFRLHAYCDDRIATSIVINEAPILQHILQARQQSLISEDDFWCAVLAHIAGKPRISIDRYWAATDPSLPNNKFNYSMSETQQRLIAMERPDHAIELMLGDNMLSCKFSHSRHW